MVIVVMGVAGSGKTTVGLLLARTLGWSFRDADEFHPKANVAKMASGWPLDDADRAPWLAVIRMHIAGCLTDGRNAVVTCSALKERYRLAIAAGPPGAERWVWLEADFRLLQERLAGRHGHFMKAGMLPSQLAAAERPRNALVLDAARPPAELVARVRATFGLE